MMLSGPEPTEPTAFGNPFGARSGQKPEPGSHHQNADEESDGEHADSSAASTSSGDFDCEIVENNSSEEEIEEQCHENARVSNQSDPSSSSQSVPSSAQTETGSGKAISNYFYFRY